MEWSVKSSPLDFLNIRNILVKEQRCFRKGCQTFDQLVKLKSYIREALAKEHFLISVSLDTEKASDMTWWHGLLRKLCFWITWKLALVQSNFLCWQNLVKFFWQCYFLWLVGQSLKWFGMNLNSESIGCCAECYLCMPWNALGLSIEYLPSSICHKRWLMSWDILMEMVALGSFPHDSTTSFRKSVMISITLIPWFIQIKHHGKPSILPSWKSGFH